MLVVTGAAHGDGVSEAVTQMGGALALMGGGPVLVVDANVRAPSLHSIFGVEQIPGLADVLAGRAELDAALRSNEATLVSVLPSGNPTDDFLSLLMSQECVSLLDRLRARFRFILVDTPPMLLYPESSLMASRSDGVVAVLRTWERNKSELFEIQRILGALRVTLFGVALTERAKQTGRARLGQRR